MKSNQKFFKKSKFLPVDNFFENILYDNQFGYYATKEPFGRHGDFITSPKVSNLFSPYLHLYIKVITVPIHKVCDSFINWSAGFIF